MRFFSRALMGLFLTALTLGLLATAGGAIFGALQTRWAEDGMAQPTRERVFSAQVVTVTLGTEVPVLTAFGDIRSARTLDLRAPAEGTVTYLAPGFAEGAGVLAGDLLLTIDPTEARAAQATARADLREAETDLADAESALVLAREDLAAAREEAALLQSAVTRQQDLLERGSGTAAALEAAQIQAVNARQAVVGRRQALAQAETRLAQAEITRDRRAIALAEADRALSETDLVAAFSGVLSAVSVTEGALVARNEALGRLIDPDALEVAFRVSTAQYARLLDEAGRLPALPVTVALDAFGLDLRAEAVLVREAGSVEAGQSGRLLFAEITAPRGLRVGDFVRVEVAEPPLDGVARLPATALGSDGRVLVVGAENRLEAVPVTLLRRQGDDVLVSGEGIDGRQVVLARTPVLGAGIRVAPIEPGAAAAPAEADEDIALDPDRRARLIAFVEGNTRMPEEARARLIAQLNQDTVPASVVARLESRMGS